MLLCRRLGLVATLAFFMAFFLAMARAPLAGAAGAAADEAGPPGPDLRAERAQALDSLRRAEAALELERLGAAVDWTKHTLSELQDFRDRAAAAIELQARFGIAVDWRQTSLPALRDIGLRATKSALLARQHGVTVDWRRYSLRQLEGLQRTMARLDLGHAPVDRGRVMPPERGLARNHRGGLADDPDALMEPGFMVEPATAWARLATPPDDVDGVLEPAFMPAAPPEMTLSPFMDGDAVLAP
jgi:hypothetical protein